MKVHDVLKRRQQEISGTTADIRNAVLYRFTRRFAVIQRVERFFHDNVRNIFGRVDSSLGIHNFGFFLRCDVAVFLKDQGFGQKQFVNLPDDVGVNYAELIGAVWII